MVVISLFSGPGVNGESIGSRYAKENDLEFISFSGFPSGLENSQSLDYRIIQEEISLLEQLKNSKNDLLINSRFAHLVIEDAIKIKISLPEFTQLANIRQNSSQNSAQLYSNFKMAQFYESLMAFGYFKNFNYSSKSNFDYLIDTSKRSDDDILFLLKAYQKRNLKLI